MKNKSEDGNQKYENTNMKISQISYEKIRMNIVLFIL